MREILRMALRNLWRRKGRTALTLGMIFLGTTLTVFWAGIAEGSYDQILDASTSTMTGQVQVVRAGYIDKPSLFHTVEEPARARQALAGLPLVRAVTTRVETEGLLSADVRTTGAQVLGVEPDAEAQVTRLAHMVKRGAWLALPEGQDALPIVLGVGLARRLRVGVGDEVSFVGQAADGSMAAELFVVSGLLESGLSELDGGLAVTRLQDAQAMLALEGRVHRILGAVDLGDVAEVVAHGVVGEGNVLLGWQGLIPGLEESIASDRAGYQVFLFIVLIVVVLGVTNTMLMSVLERTREIGVMLALGTTPGRIVGLTLGEGFWIALLGTGAGAAVGTLLNWVFSLEGIPLGTEGLEWGGANLDRMYPTNDALSSVLYPLLILVMAVLAAVLPALRAARLSPVEALRR
jgi:ABC-type lipoprotein release transport system permease subunit